MIISCNFIPAVYNFENTKQSHLERIKKKPTMFNSLHAQGTWYDNY